MNTNTLFDIAGIGNAIVDVVVTVAPEFLAEHGMPLGGMVLVDDALAGRLLNAAGASGRQSSGGSAANTIAGIGALGGRCAFIGKVREDPMGHVFRKDMHALGVAFTTSTLGAEGPASARCLVMVTPDAQRTMATFLGASVLLTPADVDAAVISGAAITYLEGYLFDPEHAKAAFRRAVELAHAAERRVALTLSDPFCVARHRDDFLALVEMGVDILFANEVEIASLLGTSDLNEIRARLSKHCAITVVTRSERGSVILTSDAMIDVAPARVGTVVDTTGAGDLYASGFLFGVIKGYSLARCGALASLCAAEAISHYGARPHTSLLALAARHGLASP